MLVLQPLLIALTALTSAEATGIHIKINWGVSASLKAQVAAWLKSQCNKPGSFLTAKGQDIICCSVDNRTTPPKNDDCPFNWYWHKTAKCCIPPREVCERDCGEGYTFNKKIMKCERDQINKCGKTKWWWKRKGECRDFDWGKDKGVCPKGKRCPKGWSWSKKWLKCKPDTPRAPEPDCKDWRDMECYCGPPPGPTPTKRWAPDNHKRDTNLRRSIHSDQMLFPQNETDKMYCPGSLHACTINTPEGGEWAFECIDFLNELESCGGCASTGDGINCSKIHFATSTSCERGVCKVHACQAGFREQRGACVPI